MLVTAGLNIRDQGLCPEALRLKVVTTWGHEVFTRFIEFYLALDPQREGQEIRLC